MNYSLLDRFRGAWLGALIGLQISDLAQARHVRERNSRQNSPNSSLFSDIRRSWIERSNQEIVSMIQEPRSLILPENCDLKADCSASTIALLLLPVVLYHHDDWFGLSNFLQQKKQQFLEEIDSILVWCYSIRLALRGELFPQGLTRRVMLGTQLGEKAYIEWLEKIEMACLKGVDSTQLMTELFSVKNREIPLALFCFSNNPQDFWLTTQQALSLEPQAANVTALSAALSGAYNGITSIPVNWRISCQRDDFYREMMVKTEEMIKDWLGIDSINSKTIPSVITAPKVLQTRSGLTVVSQQEYI